MQVGNTICPSGAAHPRVLFDAFANTLIARIEDLAGTTVVDPFRKGVSSLGSVFPRVFCPLEGHWENLLWPLCLTSCVADPHSISAGAR